MKVFATLALTAALSLPAAPLFAQGLLVVQKTIIGTTAGTSRAQIERDRMRTEINGIAGQHQVVIFDGVKQALTTIYMDQKTYTVVTKADMDARRSQAADAQARREAMIANMPPEQRARMEALMKGRAAGAGAPAAAAPKTQFRKTGTDRVGTWTCDKYEGFLNNQKVSELCTVDPRVLGFVPADFEIGKRLAEFNQTTTSVNAFAPGTLEAQGYVGVPVKTIQYTNGQPRFSFEFVAITRQSFPASSYDVPAGFQKLESPAAALGRGRGMPPK